MSNNNLTDEHVPDSRLAEIIETADEVLSALVGTNDEVSRDNSTAMCRLWDSLNDWYAPPEVVKAMALELQQRRAADKNCQLYGIVDCDGSAYIDELCVAPIGSQLDCTLDELNAEYEGGEYANEGAPYRIVALHTALPLTGSEHAELEQYREVAKPIGFIDGSREPVLYGEHIGIAIGTHFYAAPQLKAHQIRNLVNELRDIAIQCRDTQQLRAHIARSVCKAMSSSGLNKEVNNG